MPLTLDEKFEALAGTMSRRQIVAAGDRLAWLTSELVVAHGRARVQKFARRGFPSPDAALLYIWCADKEDRIPRLLTRAMGRMPACVVDHVVCNVIVAPVGRQTHGWIGAFPELPDQNEGARVIALATDRADDEILGTFAHEAAHAFVSFPIEPVESRGVSAKAQRAACELLREMNPTKAELAQAMDEHILERARDEWRVANLARSWGFSGTGCEVEHRARTLCRHRAAFESREATTHEGVQL